MKHPSTLIFLCGASASILGVAYLQLSGAPAIYSIVNVGAILIGLLFYLAKLFPFGGDKHGYVEAWMLASAGTLLVTALMGVEIEGVKRWVAMGPVQLQPGIVLVPLMTLLHARRSSRLTGLAISLAACALAMQPDRGTAGALAVATLGLLFYRRDLTNLVCAAASLIAFSITLMRPDKLPSVEFVEGVYQAAIVSGGLSGLLVSLGTVLLLAPTITIRQAPATLVPVYSTFGAVWGALIVAAFAGNYPTPLLGYGSSSVIGYLLCLFAFPAIASKQKIEQPDKL